MKRLNDSFTIRNTAIKNRICVPPLVLSANSDERGFVTDEAVRHYTALARGGAGLVIQEATCVSPDGKLGRDQIGLWCDEQIEGNRRIAEAVHAEGAAIFVQIHHAAVLEGTDVDMVDVGRSSLVDPDWARKTLGGETPGKCIHCPRCCYNEDPSLCAGRKLMQRTK